MKLARGLESDGAIVVQFQLVFPPPRIVVRQRIGFQQIDCRQNLIGIAVADPTFMAKKAAAKKTSRKKKAAKRELIDTGTDKRFVRRTVAGTLKDWDDVGKSLTADRRKKAKTKVRSGQGDKGDR